MKTTTTLIFIRKNFPTFVIHFIVLFMTYTSKAQQQEFVFQQWVESSGTQNVFFYKNVSKRSGSYIYTAGATLNSDGNYDILLTKYSTAGVHQWTKTYNGAGNGHDGATDVFIDASANVYVTGTTFVNSTNLNDIITIKYNSSGTQQWASTYNGSASSYDIGGAVSVNTNTGDNPGVYITGGTMGSSGLGNFVTVRYNLSDGSQIWANTYDYNGGYDVANKIALSGTGLSAAAVVSGGVQHSGNSWKYASVKYRQNDGTALDTVVSSGTSSGTLDEVGNATIDANGTYLYICGSIDNSASATGFDFRIAKIQNSNLNVIWERTWNSPDSLDDKAADIAVDASGNVYVTGYATSATQGKNYATLKYNSSGTLQWTKYHNGAGNNTDQATAIAIDASNNIYVTGTSHTGSSQDYYTLKYKPDNTLVWEISYNGIYNGDDKAYDIAIDPITKDVLVAGQTQTPTGYSYTLQNLGQVTTPVPANETFVSSFSFTQNRGQLVNTQDEPADNIKYYNFSASPATYFSDTAISFVLSKIDTIAATDDTLHRVDMKYILPKHNGHYGINKRSDYYNFYLAHIPEGRAMVNNYNRLITPGLYDNIDAMYIGNSAGLATYFVCKPGSNPDDIVFTFAGANSINLVNDSLYIATDLGVIRFAPPTAGEMDNNGDWYILGWQPDFVLNGNQISFSYGSYNTAHNLVLGVIFGEQGVAGGAENGNLDWSTYIGGAHSDAGLAVANDAEGNVYVTGYTQGQNFPVNNGPTFESMNLNGLNDVFVAKFSKYAEQKYTIYVGGNGQEMGNDLVVAPNGSKLYVTGWTSSNDFPYFPFSNPNNGSYYDSTYSGGTDAFIVTFNTIDGSITWGQYIGGCGNDEAYAIDTDNEGNIYLAGYTQSRTSLCGAYENFPTQNSGNGAYYQEANLSSTSTGFIAKFSPTNQYVLGTHFGGSHLLFIQDIAVNRNNGDILITGQLHDEDVVVYNSPCSSPDDGSFPLCDPGSNAYIQQNSDNYLKAFAARFSGNNNALEWCSLFGGAGQDAGTGAIFTSNDDFYIAGFTNSNTYSYSCSAPTNGGFPLCNPWQATTTADNFEDDIFIARFNNRDQLVWSTYVGAETNEGRGGDISATLSSKYTPKLAIDGFDNLFVTGSTARLYSTVDANAFPTQYQSNWYNQDENQSYAYDAFILWFDKWNQLRWATLFGGADTSFINPMAGNERSIGISVYNNETLYITGQTTGFYTPYECPPQNGQTPPFCVSDLVLAPNPNASADVFLSRFVIENLTSIKHIQKPSSTIMVFPNPATSEVKIIIANANQTEIVIDLFNATGQVVYSEVVLNKSSNFSYALNLTKYMLGVYFLSVRTDKEIYSSKIIKL